MVGGLIGSQYFGTASNCFAIGNVIAHYDQAGGLLGQCEGSSLLNCYAAVDISGNWGIGGLIGAVHYVEEVSNCYAAGTVDGNNYTGGLVGYDEDPFHYYTSCFWDSDINPDINGIGDGTDPNVIGKTTVEMKTKSTFTDTGWDFVGETIPEDLLLPIETLLADLGRGSELYNRLCSCLGESEVSAIQQRSSSILENPIFPGPGPGRPYPWPLV